MKVLLVLGLLTAVAAVVIKGTHFHAYSEVTDSAGRTTVHCFAGCDVADSFTSGTSSPEIDDAVAVARSADSPTYRGAAEGMTALLFRASRISHDRGAALVWKSAPSLLGTLEAEQAGILARLSGLTMTTQAGTLCRRAALRAMSRYQWAIRDLGRRIALERPTWRAVLRFEDSLGSTHRSFADDLGPCFAATPTDARDTVARVMAGP